MRTSVKVGAPPVLSGITGIEGLFSMALDLPGDEVTVKRADLPEQPLTCRVTGGSKVDKVRIERAVKKAIQLYLDQRGSSLGIRAEVRLHKTFPQHLGEGVPAIVAALCGVDFIYTDRWPVHRLLPIALETARAYCPEVAEASVYASLLGGVVMDSGIVQEDERFHKVFMPDGMHIVLTQIPLEVVTISENLSGRQEAKILSQKVASFILGGMTGDWALLKQALKNKTAFSTGIKKKIYEGCIEKGAIGLGTSMARDSHLVYILCDNSSIAEDVSHWLQSIFPPSKHQKIPLISRIHPSGHQIF